MDLQAFREYVRAERHGRQPSSPCVYRLTTGSVSTTWSMTPLRQVEHVPHSYPLGIKTSTLRACWQARTFGIESRI